MIRCCTDIVRICQIDGAETTGTLSETTYGTGSTVRVAKVAVGVGV